MTKAKAVLAESLDWQEALNEALAELASFGEIDLLCVFASAAYRQFYPTLIHDLYSRSGARTLIGCSGQSIIGNDREVEESPALALLALSLPGAKLRPTHLSQEVLSGEINADILGHILNQSTELSEPDINAWLLLADPFTTGDAEPIINALTVAYRKRPIIGGMASGQFRMRETHLFLNGEVYDNGMLALAVGGDYTLRPVVSQGATPIGEAWMVTAADQNMIQAISGRPALQVLTDSMKTLSPEQLDKFRKQPLVGLAVDEYKSEFGRGDYIIRNLIGADPRTGVIVIGDIPRIGQTIQFQMRDEIAADEDLRELLSNSRNEMGGNIPVAGLLFSCNGRGSNMFAESDHDAKRISEALNEMPLAGFFCNGEIGPIGSKTFLHSFTASLGLFVPTKRKASGKE